MSHSPEANRREGMETTATTMKLGELGAPSTILLTTYRRDGRGVPTPVSAVWDGDVGWFRTWDTAAKLKRMRHTPTVTVAPCTMRGQVTGPEVPARVRLLDGDEARAAARRLRRQSPVLHGVLVPLAHRLRGWKTIHLELTDAG